MPKRKSKNTKDLKSEFAEAYVNFTQFMRLDNDVKADYQLAWKGLARSSAIQCYQTQEAVDIIIPILFSDANGNKPLKKESVSAILIQVKNRSDSKPNFMNMDGIDFFPGKDYRSYITILMELGLGPNEVKEPLVSTTESTIGMTLRDGEGSEHKRYHFTISGVKGVYEGINDVDTVKLQNLLVVRDHIDDYPPKAEDPDINKAALDIINKLRGY